MSASSVFAAFPKSSHPRPEMKKQTYIVNDSLGYVRCLGCLGKTHIPRRVLGRPDARFDLIDEFRVSHQECRNYAEPRHAQQARREKIAAARAARLAEEQADRPGREDPDATARVTLFEHFSRRGLQLPGLLAGRPSGTGDDAVRATA